MNNVLLFSGGLDSYIAYHYLKKEYNIDPLCLYVDIGHRYKDQEINTVRRLHTFEFIERLRYDSRLFLGDMEEESANIPMRNSLLAHVAALYGDTIWLVVQKGEMNIPDRSNHFRNEISKLLTYLNQKQISVQTPFSELSKTDMVTWYVENGLPIEGLLMTHSCYHPVGMKPCGTCAACFRRWVSMSLNGINENHHINPWTSHLAKTYLERGQAGFYGEARDADILEALSRKGIK